MRGCYPRLARRLMRQCRVSGMADRSGGIPRSFMREFIALYKALPCLWNPKARDFNYRSSKATAYNILVEKYREVEPGASKETVQQRLSSLRNCRRKELKKVKAALELGEVYTPQLWYYNLMSFIDEPEASDDHKDHVKLSQSLAMPQVELDETPHTFEDNNSMNYTADSPAPSHESSDPPEPERPLHAFKPNVKRPREEDEEEEDMLKFLKQRIKTMRSQPPSEPAAPSPGRFQHLAYHWADKLGNLRGEQRIFAEKLINDTFYEAEFGRLGHGCRIVPFSQDIR